ncbi:hypothetical protein QWY97_09080 [Vibrio cortegadensis]|uniref:hypothetical protein n=1 Tax=Vibrio cortegadensis TaxID=1328770 RepID=UPI0021C4282F|nr:hypothetical protein [Vibrio cortegadensis]MDN3697509.1 hypothetical protein [Vibrio cortegadensis]
MKINASDALSILGNLKTTVRLHKKDNNDKMWSYKMLSESNAEFAFDPQTKTKLIVRFDQIPPIVPGVSKIEDLRGKSISTALKRVFSGKQHVAKYKAEIESEECLLRLCCVIQWN